MDTSGWRQLLLWDTKTFQPVLTHDQLKPIMKCLGFFLIKVKPSSTASSPGPPDPTIWRRYRYRPAVAPAKEDASMRNALIRDADSHLQDNAVEGPGDHPPKYHDPELPPIIDGLHIFTCEAFIDDVAACIGDRGKVFEHLHVRTKKIVHRVDPNEWLPMSIMHPRTDGGREECYYRQDAVRPETMSRYQHRLICCSELLRNVSLKKMGPTEDQQPTSAMQPEPGDEEKVSVRRSKSVRLKAMARRSRKKAIDDVGSEGGSGAVDRGEDANLSGKVHEMKMGSAPFASIPEGIPLYHFDTSDEGMLTHISMRASEQRLYFGDAMVKDGNAYADHPRVVIATLFGGRLLDSDSASWYVFHRFPSVKLKGRVRKGQRNAGPGWWKGTLGTKKIRVFDAAGHLLATGHRTPLEYRLGKRKSKGVKTEWLMMEYRLEGQSYGLCRIYRSSRELKKIRKEREQRQQRDGEADDGTET